MQTLGGWKCFISSWWMRNTFEQGNIAGKMNRCLQYLAIIDPALGNYNSTPVCCSCWQ